RLRITPTPLHSDALIADLVEALVDVWKTLDLPFAAPKVDGKAEAADARCAFPDFRKAAE
ncbi:MAG: 5-aminolevulinate synthase, partial [Rhodoblastus sp.]